MPPRKCADCCGGKNDETGPGDRVKGLQGVREAAQRDKSLRFTTLLHRVNEGRLLETGTSCMRWPRVAKPLLSAEEAGCSGSGSRHMERV
jgi:hypothetical protein